MEKRNGKVLITGAKGMLGRKVVEACPPGWETVAADLEEFDIASLEATRAFVRPLSPSLIINCAAMTDVDGCESAFDLAYRVNGLGAGNLARAAFEADGEILHVSTDYVFEGTNPHGYYEIDPVKPVSAYGRSKLAGEILVRENNPRHWIVRTQWLYGPGGKNFVDTILNAARSRPHLEVVDDQIGCPTYTNDLAAQMIRLAEAAPAYGIYHCSGEGRCSWFEFAERILEFAGMTGVFVKPITSDKLTRPAKRPAQAVLNNYHLRLALGQKMRSWEDALRDYLRSQGLSN